VAMTRLHRRYNGFVKTTIVIPGQSPPARDENGARYRIDYRLQDILLPYFLGELDMAPGAPPRHENARTYSDAGIGCSIMRVEDGQREGRGTLAPGPLPLMPRMALQRGNESARWT